MSEETTTPYLTKCHILARLWIDYQNDSELEDFISYNDLGLPIAFAISEEIVKSTSLAEAYIEETWDLFLTALKVEDTGFSSLEDVFAASSIGQ